MPIFIRRKSLTVAVTIMVLLSPLWGRDYHFNGDISRHVLETGFSQEETINLIWAQDN